MESQYGNLTDRDGKIAAPNSKLADCDGKIAKNNCSHNHVLTSNVLRVRNKICPFASQVKIDLIQSLTINSDSVYPSIFNWDDPTEHVLRSKMWIY